MTDFFKIDIGAVDSPEAVSQAVNFAVLRNNRAARERRLPAGVWNQPQEPLTPGVSQIQTPPDEWFTTPPKFVFLPPNPGIMEVIVSTDVVGVGMEVGVRVVPIARVGFTIETPTVTQVLNVGDNTASLFPSVAGISGMAAVFVCWKSAVQAGTEVMLTNSDGAAGKEPFYVTRSCVSDRVRILVDSGQEVVAPLPFGKAVLFRSALFAGAGLKPVPGPPGDVTDATGQNGSIPCEGRWAIILRSTNDGTTGGIVEQHLWTWPMPGLIGYFAGPNTRGAGDIISEGWLWEDPLTVTIADISTATLRGVQVRLATEANALPLDRERYEVNAPTRGIVQRGVYGEQHKTFGELGRWHTIGTAGNNNASAFLSFALDTRFAISDYTYDTDVITAKGQVGFGDLYDWASNTDDVVKNYQRGSYLGVALVAIGYYSRNQGAAYNFKVKTRVDVESGGGTDPISTEEREVRLGGTKYQVPRNSPDGSLGYLFMFFQQLAYDLSIPAGFTPAEVLPSLDNLQPAQGQEPDRHTARGLYPLSEFNQVDWKLVTFEWQDEFSPAELTDTDALRTVSFIMNGSRERVDGGDIPTYYGKPKYVVGGFGIFDKTSQDPGEWGVELGSATSVSNFQARGGRGNRGGAGYLLTKPVKEEEFEIATQNPLAMIRYLDRLALSHGALLNPAVAPGALSFTLQDWTSVETHEYVSKLLFHFDGENYDATVEATPTAGGATVSASASKVSGVQWALLDFISLATNEIDIRVTVAALDTGLPFTVRGWRVLELEADAADIP